MLRATSVLENKDPKRLSQGKITPQTRLACFYAQCEGWPVFPVNQTTKAPCTEHGFYDASRDCDQIEDWFEREYPGSLIAVPTGERSGLVVIDVDRKDGRDGAARLYEAGYRLPPSWTVRTRNGGFHFYYRWPGKRVSCTTDIKLRGVKFPGVDVKADGGSIIVPGCRDGYRWTKYRPGRFPLADPPSWFFLPREAPRKPASIPKNPPGNHPELLNLIADDIRAALPGSRNQVLHRKAFKIGALVKEGTFSESEAKSALMAAVHSMNNSATSNGPWLQAQAEKTAERCFDRGLRHA